jgi:hypothetical protein
LEKAPVSISKPWKSAAKTPAVRWWFLLLCAGLLR